MKKNRGLLKRFFAACMSVCLLLTSVNLTAFAAESRVLSNGGNITTDPGTADAWEDIMGTTADGNRYAGRVWVDKSVYKDGDTVTLNRKGNEDSTFTVDVDEANGEYFQVVFSALGSSMSTNTNVYESRPLDVVIVLDTSTSMAFEVDEDDNSVRMDYMIPAANKLLEDLLKLSDVRIAIVTYNADSETVIGLDKYENGVVLSTNSTDNTNGGGIIYARDNGGQLLGNDSGYSQGTNLQSGIDRGMNILANAQNVEGRTPVAIVLTDGEANRAVRNNWYNIASGTQQNEYSINAGIALSTLLNAAYGKARVENNYDTDMTVYGIGVDLEKGSEAHALMNPGDSTVGFNSDNEHEDITDAYAAFETWKRGNTATIQTSSGWWGGSNTWTFDHNIPQTSGVTSLDVAENINYVDDYQDVTSAELEGAFDEILKELSTGAFNPISDTNNGATGETDTPLIYVDNIGQYMEVKNIQALQVFGTTYNITQNANGTYSVAAGSGVNPTTKENWNTVSDIQIQVNQNADGTQQLRIYINQEILPILLDEITVTTENNVTTRTLEEFGYPPLRIYYTVGIDKEILLPNGQVDPTKIDSNYAYLNDDGTADFYSNAFGVMNTVNADGDDFVDEGDAHVGFVPSHDNRFYYHQVHQEIFIDAKNIDGSDIDWDDDMYGVLWDATKYDLTAMTYKDLATIQDTDRVYTYVTFIRPTGTGIEAEEVTYLVYTTWGALKSAVTYHDKVNDTNLNGGEAIDINQVNAVVSAYLNDNDGVESDDLIAILGMKSRRVSRLSHMFETKTDNATGTAETSYAPEYNDGAHDDGDIHEHSEVIVWLGNNGKLTLPVASGIKVTKDVTEVADGALADEKFSIVVTIDDEILDPVVTDGEGNVLVADRDYTTSVSSGKTTVILYLADRESAIILGVPDGVTFEVTEAEHNKYEYTYDGATKTVAGVIVEGVVTNAPILPGNLYITKEVVHAFGGEVFPTDYEFEFEVTFVDVDGNPIANTTFQLENNYDENLTELSTDANGVMKGKLRHGETVYIKEIPTGATVTVEEVNVPHEYNKTAPVYRSRDFSGDTADNDGEVTIVSGTNATVVVTNTYTPGEVGVNINFSGIKNFDATNMTADSEFTFKLQEYKDNDWNDVEGKTVTVTKGENAREPFVFTPLALEFNKPGVHSYQIIEVKGDNTDITYDRSVYTFSVNVVIDGNGDLEAEVVGHNVGDSFAVSGDSENGYTVNTVFTNYYHKTATSIEIKKAVVDNAHAGKTPAGFVIETYTAIEDNGVWRKDSKIRETVTDAQGEALLVRNYDNTDFNQNDTDHDNKVTYHFIIQEKKPENPDGWSYDRTEYLVTVVLTRDPDTQVIKAEFDIVSNDDRTVDIGDDGNTAVITFTNTYNPTDAKVSLSGMVKKELAGRGMKVNEFTFAIFNDGEAEFDADGNLININDAVAKGNNDAAGHVTFIPNELSFSKIGKYEFDIVEVKGDKGGVTYDSTIYDLVVEVADNGGTLVANYYFEDSVGTTVTFKNTYTVEPIEVAINGIKTLQVINGNKTMRAGDYTFGLYDEADKEIGRTTNLANGTFAFGAIKYDADDIGKTYTYTVKEIAPDGSTDGSYNAGGITWSRQSFTVTVKITDNGDGTLSTEVNGNGANNIKFVNEYNSKPVSVVLGGKKKLDGRPLTVGEFTFALYSTDRHFANPTLVKENITHGVNGDFTVELGNLSEGRHYFLLKENIPTEPAKGIHYSAAEFHITIVVTDNGSGQMSYTKTVVNPYAPSVTDADIEFTNVYIPEPGEIPLSGIKTYNGGRALEDGVFFVELYWENNLTDPIDTAGIMANGTFAFQNLTFDAGDVGKTYTYTIKEKIPVGATDNNDGTFTFGNNIYDGTKYTLTVAVSDDDKDGTLDIEATLKKGGSDVNEITFTNTFVPDPITYGVKAKKTYEKGLIGGDFEFKLVSADNKTNVEQTKANAANGDIIFDDITFRAAGEYKFKLTEKKDSILSFILPSQAEYEISITVVNENGVLRVSDVKTVNTKNTGETDLEFINTYVLDGEDEITIRGTKKLTGDRTQVEANEFEFGLYNATGGLVETVKNDVDGNFAFTTLKFDETDVPVNGSKQITYTVKEVAGDNARYTYDETVYTVVVTVEDNDQGGVTATYTVNSVPSASSEIIFTNSYTNPTPVTYTPMAQKYYNKTLNGGEFKFKLEGDINGTPISQEMTNAAGGTITFDTLSFPEAGSYTFTVKEIDKVLGFIEYSAAEYQLVVNIIDTKGVLSLGSVTVNNDPNGTIEFTNTYVIDGEDEITLRGTKTLTGGRTTLEANEFEFGLYDAAGQLIESVKNDADGNFAFTTLKFDEKDVPVDGQKEITYTVKEIAGSDIRVTYDQTVYTVVVTVEDNKQGGVKASYTVNNEADGAIAFTNIYTPKPEDITVDFDIIKTIVNKGSEKIGPEGFEFLLNAMKDGVADITVKTDENGKAKFSLTFTEDDIDETYTYKLTEVNDGREHVTYSNAEYTITVTISLNGDNELIATLTKNGENVTAVVAEFENVYEYTPTVENPGAPRTSDSFNIGMWIALLFISGGVLITLKVVDEKKRYVTKH